MADNKLLQVEIVTPQRVIFSGTAQSVTVPGSKSPFQVLFNHAPIVSSLDCGLTKLTDEAGKTIWFAVSSGFCEVNNNKVSVLVEQASNSASLNSGAIQAELALLKDKLAEVESGSEKELILKKIAFADMCAKAVEKK